VPCSRGSGCRSTSGLVSTYYLSFRPAGEKSLSISSVARGSARSSGGGSKKTVQKLLASLTPGAQYDEFHPSVSGFGAALDQARFSRRVDNPSRIEASQPHSSARERIVRPEEPSSSVRARTSFGRHRRAGDSRPLRAGLHEER